MNVLTRRAFLGMSAVVASAAVLPARAGVKPQIRKPIVFSFDWPVSGTSTIGDRPLPSSFYSIDLDTASIIDIGPRKRAFPPAKMDRYDPDVFDFWKSKGVLLVRRASTHRVDAAGKKTGFCTSEELIEQWSNALEEPGASGIAIDEFYSGEEFFAAYAKDHDERIVETWGGALKTLRKSYPDKLIFCMLSGWCEKSRPLLATFRENADFVVPQIHYDEKEAAGFPDYSFTRFRETIDLFERLSPGIVKKTVIGLGFDEAVWNTEKAIDYGDFIEAQVKAVGDDPKLAAIQGVAIDTPAALSPRNVKRLNVALKKYIVR